MTKFLQKVRASISEEDRSMLKKTLRIYQWLLRGSLIACILVVCLRQEEREFFFNPLSLAGVASTFVLVRVLEERMLRKQRKAQRFSKDKS